MGKLATLSTSEGGGWTEGKACKICARKYLEAFQYHYVFVDIHAYVHVDLDEYVCAGALVYEQELLRM